MANLASAHNLQALSKAALRYAHENVETVLQSQEFLKSPINQVGIIFFLNRNEKVIYLELLKKIDYRINIY